MSGSGDLGEAAVGVLEAAGLDLRRPLEVDGLQAWLIGNSRALWAPFVAWLRADPGRVELANPLDSYVTVAVTGALGTVAEPIRAVRWPYERGAPDFIVLAVRAGLLWRSSGGLGVHPVYGSWVALRALVVMERPVEARGPGPRPAPACTSCETACGPAYGRLPVPASEAAFRAEWESWAEARAACPVGAEHRYGEAQLKYHYTHDKAVLRGLV